jgi:hypothetical protein
MYSFFLQEIIMQFALFSFSSEHCVIDDKTIKGHSAAQKIKIFLKLKEKNMSKWFSAQG